jgi:hypothetical protein
VQNHSILESKVKELEDAYREALLLGDTECAALFNKELIYHLLRLSESIRNPEATSGTDSGKL